jgi:hypothetical protein
MSEGFSNKQVESFLSEVNKITKDYKKIKKYMKTNYFEIQKLNGTEKIVNDLLNKYYKEEK